MARPYFTTLTLSKDGSVWEINYPEFHSKQHEIEMQVKQISSKMATFNSYKRYHFLLDFEGNIWKYKIKEEGTPQIKQLNIPCAVIKIATCINCGIFLDNDSNLWAFGNNNGQFGFEDPNERFKEPKKLDFISDIVDVECTNQYSYFINNNNDVFLARKYNIEKVKISNISKIACSSSHALFLKKSGKIYGAGHTRFGKIGHTSRFGRFLAPTRIDFNCPVKIFFVPKIIDIACRNYGSICLSEDGDVIFFGYKPVMFSNPTFPYTFFWGNKNINSMW